MSSPAKTGESWWNKAKDFAKSTAEKGSSTFGENGFVVMLIVAFVLLFVIVMIYISFKIRSSKLEGKNLVKEPVRVDQLAKPLVVPNSEIPVTVVGLEYSYSLWVYIANLEQTSTNSAQSSHKIVFYRGQAENLQSANPIVVLDGVNSKMHIVIKTTNSTLTDINYTQDLSQITSRNCFLDTVSTECLANQNTHAIISVDYVPIQRWVHIAFTIDNKLLTVYLDGDVYSVKSIDEFKSMKNRAIVLDKTNGDIFVGKNVAVANGNTFDGYVSSLGFYNYAMSIDDVKIAYNRGPYKKNWLSYFGLGDYGVRAPIYKISEEDQ